MADVVVDSLLVGLRFEMVPKRLLGSLTCGGLLALVLFTDESREHAARLLWFALLFADGFRFLGTGGGAVAFEEIRVD